MPGSLLAKNVMPRGICACTAATTSGCAWPMNIGPEPNRKSTYSLPETSQTRPALPSPITMSEVRLPKPPPGSTRRANATRLNSCSFREISVITSSLVPASRLHHRRRHKEKTISGGSHASWRRLEASVHANSMHVVAVAPDIDPGLALTDGAIREAFSASTLEAGRIYELRGRVRELRIANQGASITAETQGTARDPYVQRIVVARNRHGGVDIHGYCSCPMLRNCKHVAAVLVAAHREELAAGVAETPVGTRHDPADGALPYDLEGWLASLQAEDPPGAGGYPPSVHQRLHYVLSTAQPTRGGPSLVGRPFTVRQLQNGKISHPRQYAAQNVGPPQKYLRPSDRIILARLRQAAADQLHRATDDEPVEILRRIIATGRAFWEKADGPRVTEGEPRPGSVVWRLAADGTQQTGLSLEEDLRPLDANMLWYVEPRTGVVGPITLDLPATAATRLLRSPPVPPELAERVTEELRQRLPTLKVPVPKTLPAAEKIEAQSRVWLRLINGTLPVDPGHGRGSARSVGDGLYEVPLARLAFRYGPLVVPSTAKPPPRRVSHEGKLYDVARDRAGEQKAIETLTTIGFGRVAQLAPVYYQHAHTDDFALNEAAGEASWLAIVLQIVPELRAEGWEIDIDDDFPVHVVTPDIEMTAELEEGHGIDWLELHLGVEVGGETVDLVPALVRLIADDEASFSLDGDDERPFLLPLPDGRLLSLPLGRIRPLLRALMELHAGGGLGVDGERIGFSRLDAASLAELEENSGLELKGGETLRALGRQLRDAGGTIPVTVIPDTFQGALREYQARGV